MNEQGCFAVPRLDELDKLPDMFLVGGRGADAWLDDIVHVESQVAAEGKARRRLRGEVGVDGADEVPGSSPFQDLRNVPQGADVDGRGRFSLHDFDLSAANA
jgi:hypothetical protein